MASGPLGGVMCQGLDKLFLFIYYRGMEVFMATITAPRCPACRSTQIYIRKDGTIVCGRCGTRIPKAIVIATVG